MICIAAVAGLPQHTATSNRDEGAVRSLLTGYQRVGLLPSSDGSRQEGSMGVSDNYRDCQLEADEES